MLKQIALLFPLVMAGSSVNAQSDGGIAFTLKIDKFIERYSEGYTSSTDTANFYVLDKKTTSFWRRKVTLKGKSHIKNRYDQNTYQRFFLGFYQYETETQCNGALDSLLSCMGGDCTKIKWGESGTRFKTTPYLFLINETEIIVCRNSCEDVNENWTAFKNDLLLTFGSVGSRVVDVDCAGPASFSKL